MSTKITTDIYFAAALLALGAKLDKTNKEDPRHMEFCFSAPATAGMKITSTPETQTASIISVENALNLDALETEWVNKTMKINAYDFAEAIKRMKSVVHSRETH